VSDQQKVLVLAPVWALASVWALAPAALSATVAVDGHHAQFYD
jgi:hypothetical protein